MGEPEVLIIGGGVSGLATAWWLAQQGIPVELWERDSVPGGKIRSHREQGYLTERAASMLVNFRPQIDRLIAACDLQARRCSRSDKLGRYLLHRGALAEVPMQITGMALSPLWSWRAKLRLLAEITIPKRNQPDESVASFIRRRLGNEIFETAIDPFIAGTLAADPAFASAQAVLPRLTALEQRYGSITLGMLVNRVLKRRRANNADSFSFLDGMSELTDTLAAAPEVRLRCDTRVCGIEHSGGHWQVTAERHGQPLQRRVRQLVISTPADVAGRLLQSCDRQLAALLSGIDYASLAVAHLGFRQSAITHPLNGSGFLVPGRERLGFSGNLWISSLFPNRAPAGHALLSSYIGGARNPGQCQRSDQALQSSLLQELSPLLGIRGEPDYLRIDRHPRALPLYHGDYPLRISQIEQRQQRLPGLHLNGNYLHGVSVRERIYQGMQCARRVASAAAPQPTLTSALTQPALLCR